MSLWVCSSPPPSLIWPLLMGKWDEDGMANLLLIHSSQKAKKTIIRARTHTALSHTTVSAKAQKSGLLGRPLLLKENCSLEKRRLLLILCTIFPQKFTDRYFSGKVLQEMRNAFRALSIRPKFVYLLRRKIGMGKKRENREKGAEKRGRKGSQKSH